MCVYFLILSGRTHNLFWSGGGGYCFKLGLHGYGPPERRGGSSDCVHDLLGTPAGRNLMAGLHGKKKYQTEEWAWTYEEGTFETKKGPPLEKIVVR